MPEDFDVIIVGGGPAGLTAAIYTARADFGTLVLDKEDKLLNKAESIENYFGFPEGLSGGELLSRGQKQAKKFGAKIINDEVLIIRVEGENYIVETADKSYRGRGLIIAPGIEHQKPSVEGIEDFEGRGVSYCVVCDAPFYEDKKVGLLGSENYAAKEALELSDFAENITIFTDGKDESFNEDLRKRIEDRGISILKKKVKEVFGDEEFEGLILEDGKMELDGLFVAVGTSGSVSFARTLGIPVDGDRIVVNEDLSTGLPRLYAAGDCTGGTRQVATAVGEGSKAALNLVEDLRGEGYKDWRGD